MNRVEVADRINKAFSNYLSLLEVASSNHSVLSFVLAEEGLHIEDPRELAGRLNAQQERVILHIWNREFDHKINEQLLGKAGYKKAHRIINHGAINLLDKVSQIRDIIDMATEPA